MLWASRGKSSSGCPLGPGALCPSPSPLQLPSRIESQAGFPSRDGTGAGAIFDILGAPTYTAPRHFCVYEAGSARSKSAPSSGSSLLGQSRKGVVTSSGHMSRHSLFQAIPWPFWEFLNTTPPSPPSPSQNRTPCGHPTHLYTTFPFHKEKPNLRSMPCNHSLGLYQTPRTSLSRPVVCAGVPRSRSGISAWGALPSQKQWSCDELFSRSGIHLQESQIGFDRHVPPRPYVRPISGWASGGHVRGWFYVECILGK